MSDSDSVSDCGRSISVLYTKDMHKKRKIYHDGTFVLNKRTHGYIATLLDESSKECVRKVINDDQAKSCCQQEEFSIGQFHIQVEEPAPSVQSQATCPPQRISAPAVKSRYSSVHKNTTNVKAGTFPVVNCGAIDQSLQRVMKPHQIEGAQFILNCLEPNSKILEEGRDFDESAAEVLDSNTSCPFPVYGAILADEMGLGKTLTAIAVLWAYVKGGRGKGVVVCPSSLVDNWEKEMRKWMGVKLKPLCVRSGPLADRAIRTFRVGHPAMTPVLVISYEMFRRHADALNEVSQLDIIVCDEGHRLKNVSGTKTITALSTCRARRRLVLTGTPVQNDLEELYAVLQFVAPENDLGSLAAFRARVVDPIEQRSRDPSSEYFQAAAEDAHTFLKSVLDSLMIRRTQQEVLTNILPPRREFFLFTGLSNAQENAYRITARDVIGEDESGRGSDAIESYWYRECEEAYSSEETSSRADIVLPGLQRLRQICNAAGDEVENNSSDDCNSNKWQHAQEVEALLNKSVKLRILDAMLSCITRDRERKGGGKVVVVSNFGAMLQHAEDLAVERGWKFLRLDGGVPPDRRQALVDRFNSPSGSASIFLLSAKAGGVGLNLIGANRIIMLDCDWNPAVDKQAMARVWRQGQTRPVYVYRLVTVNRIEQEVVRRQREKENLHSVLKDQQKMQCAHGNDAEGVESTLCRGDLYSLVWPGRHDTLEVNKFANIDTAIGDDILLEVSRCMPKTDLIGIEEVV